MVSRMEMPGEANQNMQGLNMSALSGQPAEDEILYLGIDLGTSRSSIAASNGVRATVASVVGYPRDEVSRKLMGRDVIFGDEALAKRLSLNMYRPLEKGVIKFSDTDTEGQSPEAQRYQRAARELIQYVISLANPLPGQKVYGVIGAPTQASIHNKRAIINAARELLDAVLIVSEPFSVAYGLDKLDDALVVDIGAGTTDLCRMHGAIPSEEDQITLREAGDAIDEALFQNIRAAHKDAQFSLNMVKRVKEQHSTILKTTDPIKVTFPVNGRPVELDITDQVRSACGMIVPGIISSIHQLVASFDPEFQDRLRNNVILAGGGSQISGLDKAIEDGLRELGGGHVQVVEEPVYAGANGGLKLAYDMPEKYWELLAH